MLCKGGRGALSNQRSPNCGANANIRGSVGCIGPLALQHSLQEKPDTASLSALGAFFLLNLSCLSPRLPVAMISILPLSVP